MTEQNRQALLCSLASSLLKHAAARLQAETAPRDFALLNSVEAVEILNEIEKRVASPGKEPEVHAYNVATRHLYVLDTLLMTYVAGALCSPTQRTEPSTCHEKTK